MRYLLLPFSQKFRSAKRNGTILKASYVGGLRKSIEDTMRLVRVAAVLALAGIIRTGLEESGGDQAWLRHAEGLGVWG